MGIFGAIERRRRRRILSANEPLNRFEIEVRKEKGREWFPNKILLEST